MCRAVLDRRHRLRSSAGFAAAIRLGRRAGSRTLVVHLHTAATEPAAVGQPSGEPQIGFVVSKGVGNAVVRNQVKRRLRHLARERLTSLPGSAVLVVRALPAAAEASYAELRSDLERGLSRTVRSGAGVAR